MAKKESGQGFLFGRIEEEWEQHWKGMPSFNQEDLTPQDTYTAEFSDGICYVHFETKAIGAEFRTKLTAALGEESRKRGAQQSPGSLGREWFSKVVEQDVTGGKAAKDRKRTQSIWWPEAEIGRFAGKAYVSPAPKIPRFPIYIPTKSRWESRLTARALDELGVPYVEVVEPQQRDSYLSAGAREDRLLILPDSGRGLVYVRNWIWDHAAATGVPWFWTMDDNIEGFYRLEKNLKTPVGDATMIWAIEEMTLRYENVGIAGMNYFMFASRKAKMPPVYINSRVYSNMLLPTGSADSDGAPFRNDPGLRYNDDTDLNLRVLKSGRCTLLFNAFLIFKATTMTVKGGMEYKQATLSDDDTKRVLELLERRTPRGEIERQVPALTLDDRWTASNQLADKHPEARVVWKWGRWHHEVDYSAFRKNKLVFKPGVTLPDGENNFGMYLRDERAGQLKPSRTVHVHFESDADIAKFGELTGQRLHRGIKETWWPPLEVK